jgi:transposase
MKVFIEQTFKSDPSDKQYIFRMNWEEAQRILLALSTKAEALKQNGSLNSARLYRELANDAERGGIYF